MHTPGQLKLLCVCDVETQDWANSIRSFAEIVTYQVSLTICLWKKNVEEFLQKQENYDITILCLHGRVENLASVNYVHCIDNDISDAEKNRILFNIVPDGKKGKMKNGILVNMGCYCANEDLVSQYKRMGYKTVIANSGGDVTFIKSIVWVNTFLCQLLDASLKNQSELKDIDLDGKSIKIAIQKSNKIFDKDETKFGSF